MTEEGAKCVYIQVKYPGVGQNLKVRKRIDVCTLCSSQRINFYLGDISIHRNPVHTIGMEEAGTQML